MVDQAHLIQSAISEYNSTVGVVSGKSTRDVEPERLVHTLCKEHDWTHRGARTIVSLANEYGAFMLRNALALAVVLNKEDGELKF